MQQGHIKGKRVHLLRDYLAQVLGNHAFRDPVVLLAHQGSDIEYNNFYCTRPHAKVLTELLDSAELLDSELPGCSLLLETAATTVISIV